MVDWLTLPQFDEHLAKYAPIGLGLRGFFHGRFAASLAALLEREPEVATVEGLGDVMVWVGLAEDTPFSVMAQRRGDITGFEISFPVCLVGPRIDVKLLDSIVGISTAFRAARYPHIENLPFRGDGFGVVTIGQTEPFFRSSSRDDAEAVARFLDDGARYSVTAVKEQPTQWIVAGPRTGQAVSRLEVVPTKAIADDLATAWSVEFGHEFAVHEGQLPE